MRQDAPGTGADPSWPACGNDYAGGSRKERKGHARAFAAAVVGAAGGRTDEKLGRRRRRARGDDGARRAAKRKKETRARACRCPLHGPAPSRACARRRPRAPGAAGAGARPPAWRLGVAVEFFFLRKKEQKGGERLLERCCGVSFYGSRLSTKSAGRAVGCCGGLVSSGGLANSKEAEEGRGFTRGRNKVLGEGCLRRGGPKVMRRTTPRPAGGGGGNSLLEDARAHEPTRARHSSPALARTRTHTRPTTTRGFTAATTTQKQEAIPPPVRTDGLVVLFFAAPPPCPFLVLVATRQHGRTARRLSARSEANGGRRQTETAAATGRLAGSRTRSVCAGRGGGGGGGGNGGSGAASSCGAAAADDDANSSSKQQQPAVTATAVAPAARPVRDGPPPERR